MADQIGVVYGVVLLLAGLYSFFIRKSTISLLLGSIFGAWSAYNATHPTRQNNVANLAIATVLGVFFLLRALVGGKWFPGVVIIALSGVLVFQNYRYLK